MDAAFGAPRSNLGVDVKATPPPLGMCHVENHCRSILSGVGTTSMPAPRPHRAMGNGRKTTVELCAEYTSVGAVAPARAARAVTRPARAGVPRQSESGGTPHLPLYLRPAQRCSIQ
jgi:hypothetical protein